MDDIKANTGLPFKNKAAATTAIRKHGLDGYEAFEVKPGVWVGRKKNIPGATDPWANFLSDAERADLEPDEIKETEPDYSGLDVVCPGCGLRCHETTDQYNPYTFANAAMLQLKEPWKGWGWDELTKDPYSGYGCLVCPDCGTALAPSGKLRVK